MPLLEPPPTSRRSRGATRRSAKRLGAQRDAGLSLRSVDERDRRRRASRKRARIEVAVVVGAAVIALTIGWRSTMPPQDSAASGGQVGAPSIDAPPIVEQVAVRQDDLADPTPFFGSYKSLHLYLPVPVKSLTELAFHQASGKTAMSIDSLLPDADMNVVAQNHSSGRTVPTSTVGPALLTGSVLRMWRSNRSGAPDTAADIGAAPGSPVYAPVTGTVVQVRPYKLYEKYDDYEIHIRPNGWDEVDVVIIHVSDPTVEPGDRVIGGVSHVASVRKLSDRVTPQLSAFTTDAGDHVHLQLNRIAVPGRIDAIGGS